MGNYLNTGKYAYEEAVNSEIFVDKSEMISFLNTVVRTKQKYVSVSRPRRFGKTMAADMLCAYYDREADSRELFEKLKLAQTGPVKTSRRTLVWDSYLGAFDVIRITMTRFFKPKLTVSESLNKLQKSVAREIKKKYPETELLDDESLLQTIDDVYADKNRQTVIVIDEWDALFRIRKDDKDGQTEYLDFLRDLFKDNSRIALAYMTGILPIKKYGEHSALNMFDEYSMMNPMQLAPYTGFTTDEVMKLCKRYGRDYERIKDWYDGYRVSDIIPPDPDHGIFMETGKEPEMRRYDIYSPLSAANAIRTGRIQNYWNRTETYEALAEYIRRDFDGLKDAVAMLMDGGRLRIDASTYQNDMTTLQSRDDVFSLLVHLGYLGYDDDTSEVFIPNREVHDEFKTSTKTREWDSTFRAFELSQRVLAATLSCDEGKVAELLEKAHDQADNKTYNSEAALSYGIQLAYYAAQKYYTTVLELDSGKGYADIAYLPAPRYPDKPALLIELKYCRTADTAIAQIEKKSYPDRLEHYKGNMLLVGINYNAEARSDSAEFKRHSCRIRRG